MPSPPAAALPKEDLLTMGKAVATARTVTQTQLSTGNGEHEELPADDHAGNATESTQEAENVEPMGNTTVKAGAAYTYRTEKAVLVYSNNVDGGLGCDAYSGASDGLSVAARQHGAAQHQIECGGDAGDGQDAVTRPSQQLRAIIAVFEGEPRLGALLVQQTYLTAKREGEHLTAIRGHLSRAGLQIITSAACVDDAWAGVAIVWRQALLQLNERSTRRHMAGRIIAAEFNLPDRNRITLCSVYAYQAGRDAQTCRSFYEQLSDLLGQFGCAYEDYICGGETSTQILRLHQRGEGPARSTRKRWIDSNATTACDV